MGEYAGAVTASPATAVNLLLILLIWTAGALACWALILHGRRWR